MMDLVRFLALVEVTAGCLALVVHAFHPRADVQRVGRVLAITGAVIFVAVRPLN
jgi:hypothetical protein